MAKTNIGKTRFEAFSDGVIAIIITIMVLELKVPHGETFAALENLYPVFLSYILSFVYLGIYWNTHQYMIHTCKCVTCGILWSNLHLLFWLSLIPFTTGWMGENHFAPIPTLVYGIVLLLAAIAYYILQIVIINAQGSDSSLKKAIGNDWKGKISPVIYIIAVSVANWSPALAMTLYSTVALIWIIPDPRIEKMYKTE